KASLLVEVQDVRVANNILGADGGTETDGELALSEFFQDTLPNIFERCRIFISQPEEADVMCFIEPGQFVHKRFHLPVSPAFPEHPLSTVGAEMWAAARKLDDSRPSQAKCLIFVPIENQFPSYAIAIQIPNGHACRSSDSFALFAPTYAGERGKIPI